MIFNRPSESGSKIIGDLQCSCNGVLGGGCVKSLIPEERNI